MQEVKTARKYAAQFGIGVLLASLTALVFVPSLVGRLFSSDSFMPHSHCYLNDPRMLLLQGLSDGLIGIAYMAIASALAYMVFRARRDIPFEWMFLAFGVFIFSCGWTHFLEVWTLWHPTYWLSGTVKALTAVASVATAIGVPPLLPRVFGLIETAKASETRKRELEKAHQELETLNHQLRDLDELKSQFFANVSHELRTPLALVLGSVEKLQRGGISSGEQRQSLEIIERNSKGLLKHVNDLLDAAKLEAGKMSAQYQEFDLAEALRLVASNFQSLAHDRGMQFQVHSPGSLVVQADPAKIERILTNLLSNAFKFAPERDQGKVRCELQAEDDYVILQVADNGPGIPPEQREAIFERFRQLEGTPDRRFGGTGLGLAITWDFVKLHKGSIWVDRSPEGGALFSVRLPKLAPAGIQIGHSNPPAQAASSQLEVESLRPIAEAVGRSQTSTTAPADAPTVLVVEDTPEMNRLICQSLASDYHTIPALTPEVGLEKARNHRLDLVLTDMMMPGMSGEHFVRKLRSDPAFEQVPIVVLTARADDQVRISMLQQGVQDYLVKPFTQEELRARAGNLISAKRNREELQRAYQELEAFSYSLAHDLRAPLRSIRSFADMLKQDHAARLGPDGSGYVTKILNSGERCDRLIEDVLSLTKMSRTPMELKPVNLAQLLRNIIQERDDFQAPRAEIQLQEPLPLVMGDQTSLTQVTTNLLSNAVKYVPPGTTPRIEIFADQYNSFVRVVFKDNGIGIAPRDQERIFGLFQRVHSQREYEGTGLGLAIARKAIERMGGRIGVDSAPGQGSRFWFELRTVKPTGS